MYMVAHQSYTGRWTEAEFYAARDAAPPGERWELVDGEVLVTPSPRMNHQLVSASLLVLLYPYVRAQRLGRAMTAPLDVKLQPGLVTQPDLLVVPTEEFAGEEYFVTELLLVVEIISPSSARFDRVVKRPRYQRSRVPEYWVIDQASRTFERWQPDDERPAILSECLVWHPKGASAPFELDIPAFFLEAESV